MKKLRKEKESHQRQNFKETSVDTSFRIKCYPLKISKLYEVTSVTVEEPSNVTDFIIYNEP